MKELTMIQAKSITGGCGHSSKMPWLTYGLSAFDCQTGAQLAKIEGTPCHVCYAMKDHYAYPSVRQAHLNRLKSLKNHQWVKAMVTLIEKAMVKTTRQDWYFRWFDSGDLQSLEHLNKIAKVSRKLPQVTFWLPTQEREMVRQWLATNRKPGNLVIRYSSPKIGVVPHSRGLHSVVLTKEEYTLLDGIENNRVFLCPSSKQDHQCQDCRQCWNTSIKTIGYLKH